MIPSYQENDLVVMQRFTSNLQKGDVIICKLEIDGTRKRIIKRLAAVPGDDIQEIHGMLLINGEYVATSQYGGYHYKLNTDEYFLLGDNKNSSLDSRYFGPISKEEIIGKVILKTERLNMGNIWEWLDNNDIIKQISAGGA
jgi:signal peptidase I